MFPQIFVATSLGAGLGNIIENNLELPSFTDLIFSPDIFLPILGFIFLIIIGIIIRNFFYEK